MNDFEVRLYVEVQILSINVDGILSQRDKFWFDDINIVLNTNKVDNDGVWNSIKMSCW